MRLRAAIGRTTHTAALLDGQVPSGLIGFDFADVPVITRAFAPMVRELAYDVSEIAIATFLQARALGTRLVLLPVVLSQRFQEGAVLCRSDGPVAGPQDLAGRRVGIRAYGQTTCMWVRGVLAESHGVAANQVRWVTFEGAHVAGIADPPWTERAAPGSDMMAMLRDGALDAVIVGSDVPNDAGLRPVFPDPAAAAAAFRARHGLVPVNHMLCMRQDLVADRPELAREVMRMVAASAALSETHALPAGFAAVAPAVALALSFAQAQGLLPHELSPEAVWDGLPPDLRDGPA